ncbi:hypothetical protein IMSHALPRED_005936 [Imshaugia aleurites]|uniref:Choline/carnitine acyltransferase domain-containing protein n=1 Tax=Imshaugia aleurites TaxID=172621 RepID=A0A8H3IRM7_9LECA|nr:hypothetical protein IMSHALPRED_005936 [Imshaugia aleurites]
MQPGLIQPRQEQTAFNDDFALIQHSKVLREAVATHTSTMTLVSIGRGFALHFEALREVAQQAAYMPELFDDPTWEMMRMLSSRKLKTDASGGLKAQKAGFSIPDSESFFIHYDVDEEKCRLLVQSAGG